MHHRRDSSEEYIFFVCGLGETLFHEHAAVKDGIHLFAQEELS